MLLVGAAAYALTPAGVRLDMASPKVPGLNCKIKGNVSQNTGERIYHVPGQKFYEETRIRPEFGEKWFCSEEDARSAGWRKSRS